MQVASIFLDPKSLNETNGNYGIVTQQISESNFSEQYINKKMLLHEIQEKVNIAAQDMAMLPPDADRVAVTTEWMVLNNLLNELKVL